jgi:thiol:disulfide interchange protein DsbC
MRPTVPAALPLLILAILLAPAPAAAFGKNDPAAKSCTGCHALTREEAASILAGVTDNIVGIVPGPVRGIWEIDASIEGKTYPIYVDYAKKYILQGQFLRLPERENITRLRHAELNRVDVSSIPLKDAILVGNGSSKRRIIVLTDPSCPYCMRLHGAIREAAAKDPEAAFYIMPYPRNPEDKAVYSKCLAAVCDKSGNVLDDIFAGKPAPPPACKSGAVDETIRLVERLRIQGTPSMILPDGRIVTGYMEAEALLGLTR